MGSVLVPKLLASGRRVRVLDLYLYGDHVLDASRDDPRLEQIRGDMRDLALVKKVVASCDAVIHLACISNDPSFELDPVLGRSINYDAFGPIVEAARDAGVRRFIYASTSSVYGVSDAPEVREDHPLRPLTDYSKYKVLCEQLLLRRQAPGFTCLILRPATICGWSPRLRLDLSVNLLTSQAVHHRRITVFGGQQKRPNIHIQDMTDLYVRTLEYPEEKIAGRIFNVGYQNHTLLELARIVKEVVEAEEPDRGPVEIVCTPSDDHRSYHICSDRIRRELGFEPRHTVEEAVRDLISAFRDGRAPHALTDSRYYNVKRMKEVALR